MVAVGFFWLADALPKDELICYYEVGLSQEVKTAGWNLAACLERYNSIDCRLPHDDINPTSRKGDPLYKGAHFGWTASCDELVFIKANRNLIGDFCLYLRTWRELRRVKSPLVVGWCEYRRLRRYLLLKTLCLPLLSLWRKVAREK